MLKIFHTAFILVMLTLLFAGCQPDDSVRFTDEVSEFPSENNLSDSGTIPTDPGDSLRLIAALDLCAEFSSEIQRNYPELAFRVPNDELDWYYVELDSAQADNYADIEAQLYVFILQLRQSVHVRIDNIRKMGNPVPEGLYDFLKEYDDLFAALGF